MIIGGQGHAGRAREPKEKAREGIPRAALGPTGFPLGTPGSLWVPLASKNYFQTSHDEACSSLDSLVRRWGFTRERTLKDRPGFSLSHLTPEIDMPGRRRECRASLRTWFSRPV